MNRIDEDVKKSCICLYGDPCVNEYGCNDWDSRMAITAKKGGKGLLSHFSRLRVLGISLGTDM